MVGSGSECGVSVVLFEQDSVTHIPLLSDTEIFSRKIVNADVTIGFQFSFLLPDFKMLTRTPLISLSLHGSRAGKQ